MPTRVVFALLALCVLGYSYTVDFYYCDYRGGTTFCNNFPLFGQGEKVSTIDQVINQDNYPYCFTSVDVNPGPDFEFFYNRNFMYTANETVQGYFTMNERSLFNLQVGASTNYKMDIQHAVGKLQEGKPHTSLFFDNSLNITLVLH